MFVQVPVSLCSAPCPPGSRQARRPREPRCCFDCLPCADGEISNHTGRLFYVYYVKICYNFCMKQIVNETTDTKSSMHGLCMHNSNVSRCSCNVWFAPHKVPLSVQNVLSTTGQTKTRSNVSLGLKNSCLSLTPWASSWWYSLCWVLFSPP